MWPRAGSVEVVIWCRKFLMLERLMSAWEYWGLQLRWWPDEDNCRIVSIAVAKFASRSLMRRAAGRLCSWCLWCAVC